MTTFTLANELLLLAIDDVSGAVHNAANVALDFGLAGALLTELSLNDRLTLDGKKLRVADPTPLGNGALDAALAAIGASPKARSTQDWVTRLPRALKLRQRLLDDLVAGGVLERRREKILRIFPTTRYPQRDGAVESALRARIDAVLRDGATPDQRTRLLIRLIKSCNLINALYPRAERKAINRRITELTVENETSQAIERAVADTQAAISAAVIASSVAATASCAAAASSASC